MEGEGQTTLTAGVAIETLVALVKPARQIARAIPLPSVANRQGITAVHPPVPAALTLFDRIGRAVPVKRRGDL